jgi:hypothetical protein
MTAHKRDRDVTHRGIRFGAMPVPLTRLDMHNITYIDLTLFMLGGDHA